MSDYIDMRKLNSDELLLLRRQVVRMKKKGMSGKEIESCLGVRTTRISEIWSKYKKGGDAALKPAVAGRKHGTKRLLSAAQEKEIRQTIIDKTPNQIKMSFGLWTRQAIKDFIKRKYKVEVTLRTVTNYLKRWGFTCQRPTKKAYSQDDVQANRFMKEEYPKIAERAKKEKAEIYWSDETGVSNQEHYQRGFAPKGKTPVLRVESKRERINMISAITGRGSVRFMIYDGPMNQKRLLDFIKRLVKDSYRKVFLILDNLKVHHGKLVKEWVDKNKDKIELFFLPPYSPELNPDEYLNHVLKQDVHSGISPRTKADLHSKTESFMRRMQHDKSKIAALFEHEKLQYIRDCA